MMLIEAGGASRFAGMFHINLDSESEGECKQVSGKKAHVYIHSTRLIANKGKQNIL